MMTTEEKKAYQAAWYVANSEKIKARQAAYYVANSEKIIARSSAYYAANREKRKASIKLRRRMKKYGLSSEAFQLMLLRQNHACGICKETFLITPAIDHDHKTGGVRGLLCLRCNTALGGFRDSLEILESAKQYLQG